MKTIVIFGAASAIAQATAKLLLKEKPTFVLIDRDEQKLNIIADDLKTRGASSVHAISADLTVTSQHKNLWEDIKRKAGTMPDTVLIAYGTLGNQSAGEKDFAIAEKEI